MKKNLIVIAFLMGIVMSLFQVHAHPESTMLSPALPVDSRRYIPYSYVRFLGENDSIDIDDETFYDISGRVIFKINKYTLPKNDSLLKELDEKVLPMINRDSLQIACMMIRGAASPEGPFKFNQFLGKKRAEALLDFVTSRLAVPVVEDKFEMQVTIEDFRTLCLLMRRAGDKDYGYVQSVCDKYLPKDDLYHLKQTLVKAREGRLWLRLYREYFHRLRAARIILFFYDEAHKHDKPFGVEPQPEPEPEPAPEPEPVVEPEPDKTEDLVQPVPPISVQPAITEDRLPRREVLSVKSNLLFDVAYVPGYDRWCPIPNVAVEFYPRKGHFTYGASFDFPWWQHYWKHKYFQIRNYQLESRYYFRSGDLYKNPAGEGAAFRGFYLQGYVHAALFGICFSEHRGWVGEGLGGGVGAGYVLPLSKKGHWRLEFGAQVGYFGCRYDPYQFENPVNPNYIDHLYYYKWTLQPELFKKRQYRFNWFGPTRVGITLTYDLLYKRVNKKGISFRPWEKITGQLTDFSDEGGSEE